MNSKERVLQLMQDSVNSLRRVGLLEQQLTLDSDTVLLGTGSLLDSIAFVTFITGLEDRLNQDTDKEIFLVLNDIHEFNADTPFLSADTLARYIVELIEE